jgi:hypothetical protein
VEDANAHFNRGLVFNQLGHILGDLQMIRLRLGIGVFQHRFFVFHNIVKVIDVDKTIAETSRHPGIDLGDH